MPTKREIKREINEQQEWFDYQWIRHYEDVLGRLELGLKGIKRYIELRLKYEPGIK